MPDQPSWIHKVPQILAKVTSLDAPLLDRPAIESLFGLRRRQAIALLHRLGGYQVGKTFLVSRDSLLEFLRDPGRQSASAGERGRFERVRVALGEARQESALRQIAIPAQPETLQMELAGLPAGIRLEPGQLTVAYATPADLFQKLFVLSQALGNDFDAFERSWLAAQPAGGAR
jgi:hypothetical protein